MKARSTTTTRERCCMLYGRRIHGRVFINGRTVVFQALLMSFGSTQHPSTTYLHVLCHNSKAQLTPSPQPHGVVLTTLCPA